MKYLKIFEDFSADWDDEDEEEDDLNIMFEIGDLTEDMEDNGMEAYYKFHVDKVIDYLAKNGINGVKVKDFKGKASANAMGGADLTITIKIPATDKQTLTKIEQDLERFEHFDWVKTSPKSIKINCSEFVQLDFIPEIYINTDDL